MDGVINDLRSIQWWFGVVIVGLAINLGASYLKPYTDRVLGAVRLRWVAGSRVRQARNDASVDRLRGDPHRQLLVSLYSIRLQQSALRSFIEALAYFAFSFVPSGSGWRFALMGMGFAELVESLRVTYQAGQLDRTVLQAAAPDFVEARGTVDTASHQLERATRPP